MAERSKLDELLESLMAALGGHEAIQGVHSIAATADCVGPRGPYTTEVRSVRGGRLWFRQSWPDRPPFLAVVNGPVAWMRDELSGDVAPLDKVVVAMIRSHEFQLLPLELDRRYRGLQLAGQEVFADQVCHSIQMQDELDMPCRAYLGVNQPLLVGQRMADTRRGGEAEVQVELKTWAWAGPVLVPVEVVASDAGGSYTLRFHTVELNAVDEAIFEAPPELQA